MRHLCAGPAALLLACASACTLNLPAKWTGFSAQGQGFGDVYQLQWNTSQRGAWSATLLRGPGDTWATAAGQLSPDNTTTSIVFSNGVRAQGTLDPASCAKITWDGDKTSWAALPPPPAPPSPQCQAITAPSPCGQSSDSYERCTQKGCCYDPTAAYPCYHPGGNAVPITHVHVIQASHFDAGFAYTIKDVLQLWWYTHFPRASAVGQAIDANATLAATIGLRFTAQAWLIDLFFACPPGVPGLRCPTPAEQAALSTAIARGWITWHAFPFNSEAELHLADTLLAGVQLVHALDDRFAQPRKATMSQRDVPGTTRAVIPVLAAANVTAFSIGVNGASTPPFTPRAFVWRDAQSGASMPMMVHPYGYGDIGVEDAVVAPGLAHAMVFAWRGDNAGPPMSTQEIEGNFAQVRREFPGAAVFSSTLDNFTQHLVGNAGVLAQLPVVTSELGDTWLHGAASEPVRAAFFKRASALRAQCVASGTPQCAPGDAVLANFTRFLLKCGEHTWGKDIKSFLHDTAHWSNAALAAQLAAGAPNFLDVVASWAEQRDWCATYAVEALAVGGHPLAAPVAAALSELFPPPEPPSPAALGYAPFAPGALYTGSAAWEIAFDGASGAVSHLRDARPGGRVWADAASAGTFLAQLHYTALSAEDYAVFTGPEPGGYYPFPGAPPDWFAKDFGKPNVSSAAPVHSETPAALLGLYLRESPQAADFLVRTSWAPVNGALHSYYGAPAEAWLALSVPRAPGAAAPITASLTIYNKTATRLPEGLYLRFNASAGGGWRVSKLGSLVDPFDVVPGGNHHQHGMSAAAALAPGGAQALSVASTDFSQAQFGRPIPLPTPVWANGTSASEGMSVLLIDNTWGCVRRGSPARDKDGNLNPRRAHFFNPLRAPRPRPPPQLARCSICSTNYPAWINWRGGEENMRWTFELSAGPVAAQ